MATSSTAKESLRTNIEHFWSALWMAMLLLLGLGVTSLIDNRIHNHPDMLELKESLAKENVKIEAMSKTLIRLEIYMESTDKTMNSIWDAISKDR
jgi:hypothetical protein